jgi:hypothetical protein
MITYVLMTSLIIIIFVVSLEGVDYELPGENEYDVRMPWYQPLFNNHGEGVVYEIVIICAIMIQLHLSKQWGVFYRSLFQIESIFRAYVRMKLNNFNQEM